MVVRPHEVSPVIPYLRLSRTDVLCMLLDQGLPAAR